MIWHVTEQESDLTVDLWLQQRLPQAPKGYLHQLLRKGSVSFNDRPLGADDRLQSGMAVRLPNSQRLLDLLKTPAISNLILAETDEWVALNKPAGLAVHPTSQRDGKDLLSLLKTYYQQKKEPFKVAPAHRIDRGTSGVVLFGKGRKALAALGALFTEHRVHKTYLALVHGQLNQPLELVSDVQAKGKTKVALANAVPIASNLNHSLLQLTLTTGRTHQLRQQLADAGLPIVGDRRYGTANAQHANQLCLHSWKLELPTETSAKANPVQILAPLPDTLQNRILGCGLTMERLTVGQRP